MKTKEELKFYFENGDRPTQEQFWEWQDSYWHKDEKLDNTSLNLNTYDEFIYSPNDPTEITGIDSTIVFPEGIKTIGGFRFTVSGKRISKIKFSNTIEKIKSNAFNAQYLRGILEIPESCKIIESFAFSSSVADISELILRNGIETLEEGAFQLFGSKNLTELFIPESVRFVGKNAFNIPALKSVRALQGLDLTESGIPATASIIYYTKE